MDAFYRTNDDFVNKLCERILLSIREAISNDVFMNSVLCNVLTLGLQPNISPDLIKGLVDACLLASLEREEGKFNNFSVVFEPTIPDEFRLHYKFETNIPLTPSNLKKLAPAFNPDSHQIGVWFDEDDLNRLVIWGFMPKRYIQFLSVNSISPSKISLGCISGTDHSFKCLVSLSKTGFVNPISSSSNPIAGWHDREGFLTYIHTSLDFNSIFSRMFQAGYGGTVILVRENQDQWKQSIERPALYEPAGYIRGYKNPAIVDKYDVLREYESRLERKEFASIKEEGLRNRLTLALERAKASLEDISNLTKIDGATILSQNFTVLGSVDI